MTRDRSCTACSHASHARAERFIVSARTPGPSGRSGRFAFGAAALVIGALAWGEWMSWRASRTGFPSQPPRGGREVVVVLGYGNRGERANIINRWRVRAGLRTLASRSGARALIVSGGPVHSRRPEAELLRDEARRQGWRGEIITESRSLSTRQNIENVSAVLSATDRISIVSDPVHAERARRILRDLRPDLADRLVPGAEYRWGERPVEKLVGAVLALSS